MRYFRGRKALLAKIGLVSLIFAPLAACGGASDDAESSGEIQLDLAHDLPESNPYHECGVANVPQMLEEEDAGISMTVYPAGSGYGGGLQLPDALVSGDLDLTIVSPGVLASYSPAVGVLDAPYLFESPEQVESVLDGPVGDKLWDAVLEDAPLRVVGLGYFGTRHVTANRRAEEPEDFDGAKLRVPEGPQYSYNADILGANGVSMPFTEVYVSLQQGVIDGQENPLSQIAGAGLDEVQSHLILTGHNIQYFPTIMSQSSWETLSEDQQSTLTEVLQSALSDVAECQLEAEEEILAEWTQADSPIEVVEPDAEAFQERAEEMLPGPFADEWGDMYEQIRAER